MRLSFPQLAGHLEKVYILQCRGKRGDRDHRTDTKEFKIEAVELAEKIDNSAQAERDLKKAISVYSTAPVERRPR